MLACGLLQDLCNINEIYVEMKWCMVAAKALGLWHCRRFSQKVQIFTCAGSISSGDLTYSTATVVSFQILCAWKRKRVDLKWSHHKKGEYVRSDRCVSKLGCCDHLKCMSNYPSACLKYIQFLYVSCSLIKIKKKKKRKRGTGELKEVWNNAIWTDHES